ncbi:MAG: hypothetical protein KatS3mg087_0768 [Patescibacteria group bacterium]|nr:MAG: hypothetical protein KatS3mg087_0768 [Patescibacteria group bacterium]
MSNQTWNLSQLLQSDTDPLIQSEQKEITQAIDIFAVKWEPRTDYLENAHALAEAPTGI